MVSSSCSTTISVLPRSRSFFKVSMSLVLSRWCKPILGSSRIYSTPIREEPICVARRIRWLSPPESVPARLASVRYSSPTLQRNPNRSRISFKISLAMTAFWWSSVRFWKKSSEFFTASSQTSAIFKSPTVTASVSFFRRLPWQDGHSTVSMNCS